MLYTMRRIDLHRTYTKEEALKAVPILTARQIPAMISGSELHRLAVSAAIKKFNEKKQEEER